jgi:hypothetical protein
MEEEAALALAALPEAEENMPALGGLQLEANVGGQENLPALGGLQLEANVEGQENLPALGVAAAQPEAMVVEQADDLLNSDKFIADENMEAFVAKYVKPHHRALFDLDKLKATGGEFEPPFFLMRHQPHLRRCQVFYTQPKKKMGKKLYIWMVAVGL